MALHYVRQGATGTGSGNDWVNAYTSLPATLQRGDTYYIAGGSYGGITINTNIDSTALTIIKKAIGSDHGTDTGWNAAYGTSQAVFNQTVTNNANYIVFDGQTGGGPGSWTTGFGFKIIVNSKTSPATGLNTAPDYQIEKHHLTFLHFEVEGNHGDTSTSASNDCVVVEKGTHDVTMRYCYLHDAGRCPFIINSQIGNVFTEYAYTGAYSGNHAQHAEIASILPHFSYNYPTQNIVFANSLFTFIDSTGGLMFNSTSGAVYGCVFYFPNGHQAPNGVVGTWSGAVCRNIKVYNNTFLTPPSGAAINFVGDRQSGNEVYNNLFYNVPSAGVESANLHDYNHFINSGGVHGEAHGTSVPNGDPFVNYLNLNFQLTGNTPSGTVFPAPYNIDPMGTGRSSWTRGAYEFGGTGPAPNVQPSISVNPSTPYNFGLLEAGATTTDLTLSVANTGTGTLTGSVSASAPFSIVSGGSYSLTAGQNQSVVIRFRPTVKGVFTQDLSFSGAQATTVTISGSAYPLLGTQFFPDDMLVSGDFTVTNHVAAQQNDTQNNIRLSGQLRASFVPTVTGNYSVSALVNVSDASQNSFRINLGTDPTDPTMIWDVVQLTDGLESRTACWRGTGTFDNPQFVPKTWALTAGTHYQLIIFGREANAGLGQITINPPTTAPVIPAAPDAPASPTPTNSQTNVQLNTPLAWAENTPGCLFHVFFGTTNPPPQVASELTTNLYNIPAPLAYSTTYYFKVNAHISWSSNGQSGVVGKDGPVWSFTTLAAPVALPPIVTLAAPAEGTIYTAPATVNFAATAAGQGGATISKVEYYIDNVKVDEDITFPYTGTEPGVAAGDHTLKAKAIDSNARTTDSTAISIHVMAPGTAMVPRIIFVIP